MTTRDIPIRKEYDTYREKENECVFPILEILSMIFNVYVSKFKKNSNSLEYFNNILDQNKTEEITIYDYLKDEILEKKDAITLIKMKSDLIKEILMHDSEGLHNTILTWMIDKELFDDLEKVVSPYYDKFVEKVENQGKLNINQISLVYKYLFKTQKLNRLIHFLIPIIWTDTLKDNSKVQGELSIKHRLLHIDLSQKACEACNLDSNHSQNLANIIKSLEKAKTILIIQSDIENLLKIQCKGKGNENIIKKFKTNITLLNTRVFTYDELIDEVTKPMKLHDFTIKLLFNKVLDGDQITSEMREEISDCYCSILNYFVSSCRSTYPK